MNSCMVCVLLCVGVGGVAVECHRSLLAMNYNGMCDLADELICLI